MPLWFSYPVIASAEVPLVFENDTRVESSADGGLPLAVGVHNIQVVRANRTTSPHADGLTDTYLHAPMLAHWRGRFYLEYLSGPVGEHEAPCQTSLVTSDDGQHWDQPRIVFPAFRLPDGTQTLAHQRMGFFQAPDGRLLVLAYYGRVPSPNDGTGIGRAVREIRPDGTFGPIHFIKLNSRPPFPDFTPPYPRFTSSPDAGFVAACEALLADKLITAQWWEEDQGDESGFYTIKGKALSTVRRPDGSVLGIWKNALVSTTHDEGRTWVDKQFGINLPNNASKYWLQRTGDGRYALALNPTNRLRFPLALATSEDCHTFSHLATVHGELPDQRFPGEFKNLGPQYVRGIEAGDAAAGDPTNPALWLTYSVNKEDIWVSRVPVPVRDSVDAPVRDDFSSTAVGALPTGWNVYSPAWAPVRVVDAGPAAGRALELRDEEPYDYARAIRVFPHTHGVKVAFKVLARQTSGRLEIELADRRGERPYVLAFGEDGHLWANHEGVWTDNGAYAADRWYTFELELPTIPTSDRMSLRIDGREGTPRAIGPLEATPHIERLSFRTGAYRERGFGAGRDLPGANAKAPAISFLVDDVAIEPQR
ncbi:MAG: exo-alpha-sialidase [Opitutaceae bacterium]|nr:exo-alpha-sialidase [Opitutaceae bacterium]